jgi:transcriptional regulator with XRE-family HTH domain
METLGEKIRKIRRRTYPKNAERFAQLLGVGTSAVYKYERNESRPSYDQLDIIAEVGGTTVSSLLGYEKDGNGTVSEDKTEWNGYVLTDNEKDLVNAFRSLDADGKQKLLFTVLRIISEVKRQDSDQIPS